MFEKQEIVRGGIYYIYPREVVGSEMQGGRPAIVVSNHANNKFSQTVEVVFLTTKEKRPLPTHVKITSASRPSTALCEQIVTIDKERVGCFYGMITEKEQEGIDAALQTSLMLRIEQPSRKLRAAWDPTAKATGKRNKVAPAAEDISSHPDYIRVSAERDVYKNICERFADALKDNGILNTIFNMEEN